MAPITDDKVQDLKDHIHKLETRVIELERRLESGGKKPEPHEAMRMILMGPPGAGAWSYHSAASPRVHFVDVLQAREHKLLASRKDTASAIWYALRRVPASAITIDISSGHR
jgi:hypothetical protein